MEKRILILIFIISFTIGYPTRSNSFAFLNLSNPAFQPSKLLVEIQTKNATDNDTEDGFINIKVIGGVPPYTIHYLSTNSEVQQTKESSFEIKAKPGLYVFIIQDSKKTVIKKEVEVGVKK